jgi:hypothetical protein
MHKLQLGLIYFVEEVSFKRKDTTNKPLVGSAVVSKIGRKYAEFSKLYDRDGSYFLSNYRYNLSEQIIEYRYSSTNWKLFASSIFTTALAAAEETERRILVRAMLCDLNRFAVDKLPLEMLRTLTPCLNLDEFDATLLNQLRQIRNPPLMLKS